MTEFLDSVGVNDVAGVQELFRDLVSSVLENGLEGELDEEFGHSKYDYRNKEIDNSRNGYHKKTVKSSLGKMKLKMPRERKGEYEPQLIKKQQTTLTGDIEDKILSMYAKGMSSSDNISLILRTAFNIKVSHVTISNRCTRFAPLFDDMSIQLLLLLDLNSDEYS